LYFHFAAETDLHILINVEQMQDMSCSYLATLISTFSIPLSRLEICEKAILEKSMILPLTKGPLSLILTLTDFPLLKLVTITTVPKGKVFEPL